MNNTRIIYETKDFQIFSGGFVAIDNKDITLKDVILHLVDRIKDRKDEFD